MRILVTGGAGYIGSITVRALIERGHDVVVIDTLEKGHRWAVDKRATFFEASVGNREIVTEALKGVDVVMHLAGYIEVGESTKNPERYFDNNVAQAKVLLDCMIECGVDALVFSSTAAVYGQPKHIPLVEDDELVPINPYGESKLRFEKLLDEYALKGMRSIRFRYFNVAGAWPDGSIGEAHHPETHLIPNIIRAFLTENESVHIFGDSYPTKDGTCIRDYIHVCDLAQAHIMGIEALGAGESGGVYNLGNGQGFSNREIVHACAQVIGLSEEEEMHRVVIDAQRPGDPAVLVASSAQAYARFGWQPRYNQIQDIISHAVLWHKKQLV